MDARGTIVWPLILTAAVVAANPGIANSAERAQKRLAIAYSSDQDDPNGSPPAGFPISPGKNFEIYATTLRSSEPVRLTDAPGNDQFLAWSPDGTRIAFESSRVSGAETTTDYDIFVMDADGSNVTRLTFVPGFDAIPVWSPDGSKIAFTSARDGDFEIYVMDADGSDQTRVTHSPGWDFAFSWCGDLIALNSDRGGVGPPGGPVPWRTFDVFTMNPDGGDLTRLTTDPGNDGHPSFSPDCARIAFSSARSGNAEIYVMNADGSNPVRLTHETGETRHPSWSPDGSRIVFDSDVDGDFEIYAMNRDGTELRQLTDNERYDFYPRFSPRPVGNRASNIERNKM